MNDDLMDLERRVCELNNVQLGCLIRTATDELERRTRSMNGLLPEEREAFYSRSKLDCIKMVRDRTGLGLIDAKAYVERYIQEEP